MKVRMVMDWVDLFAGETHDLPDCLGQELIQREIAINADDMVFNLDRDYWTLKDVRWKKLFEKDS